ncbi:MAG: hypothetical protein GY869_06565 [Planctomycetes bacterium]|nr:hypothetical protein [Planctomycetota bacterium]
MKHNLSVILLTISLLVVQVNCATKTSLLKVVVEAGEYTRINTPVSIDIDIESDLMNERFSVWEVKGTERIPVAAQVEPGNPLRLWWILQGETGAGEKRIYELDQESSNFPAQVEVRQENKTLQILHEELLVLQFHQVLVLPPEGSDELFIRNGFIHPLWSPGGKVLTQIHPSDHIHHLGLWHPWTKLTRQGREIDFWNLNKGEGTVRYKELEQSQSGSVFGSFRVLKEHIDLKDPAGETKVLDEELQVRVWHQPGSKKGYLIDYIIMQENVLEEPIILEAYRYGGMGLRATEKWSGQNRNYLTSEGNTIKDADGTRARWCNVFGSFDEGAGGILFMGHPENRKHPEPIRIWDEEFEFVFFNFCPVKQNPWTIRPGEKIVLKYRLYVYDGEIDVAKSEQLWIDFAHPPQVIRERNEP